MIFIRAFVLAISACALTVSAIAHAQPTGNPKGSVAPSTAGQADKKPATRAPDTGARPKVPGEAVTNPDNPISRSGNARTPGIGTTGGLTGRHPGDGSKNSTTQTDQAPTPKK